MQHAGPFFYDGHKTKLSQLLEQDSIQPLRNGKPPLKRQKSWMQYMNKIAEDGENISLCLSLEYLCGVSWRMMDDSNFHMGNRSRWIFFKYIVQEWNKFFNTLWMFHVRGWGKGGQKMCKRVFFYPVSVETSHLHTQFLGSDLVIYKEHLKIDLKKTSKLHCTKSSFFS